MDVFKYTCVLFLLRSSVSQGTLSQTNSTVKPEILNTTDNGYAASTATGEYTTCQLVPKGLEIRDEIASLANDEYQLVKLKVQIDGTNITTRTIYSASFYHPRKWVIATSATGKAMLMLREYFEPMSMYTLGLGVAKLDVSLKQHPANCLDNIQVSEIGPLFRSSILYNFGSDASLPELAEVCNQHIVTKGAEKAKLVYLCCRKDLNQDGAMQCLENTETIWIKMLFISLLLIQGFIVAFCPLILPETFFKTKTVFQQFLFKTDPDKSLVLNVKRVDSATHVSDTFVKTRRNTFTHLSGFKNHLAQMTTGKVYKMYVNGVDMSVLGSKIIANGSAPVGVVNFIYQFFIRCALRTEIISVSECCNAKMCKSLFTSINLRWYQCLQLFMLLLFMIICASPWIIRVWFYYIYEKGVVEYQKELYKTLNLHMPFNSFVVSYLSPTHPLFITIYILLGLEVVFYLPQTDAVKRKLKFTIRKCFRDMRESSRVDACGYFMSKMLYPLTRFGIVGCLVAPLWVVILPFLLLLLLLEAIPIANLTLRLISNLVYYTLRLISPKTFSFVGKDENGMCRRWINKRLAAILVTDFQEENTRLNQMIHVSSLIMTLVSIWCMLFLAADCLAFFVECIVYGLVGFILNPKYALKYVSLFLLIVVYGIDCFNGVKERYIAYGQAINSKIQTMIGEKLKDVAMQNAKDQVNSAFRIENNEETEPMYLVAGSERFLKWRAPRLVLFLDSSDIPFIPKSFLMQMGRLKHAICPGQVHKLYLKALLDFSLIILFLFFVFIVIFAFGQANDISSAGQVIAALGSGFLPLIFKKFLFKPQAGPSVDTSNMKWHYMFLDAVGKYKDRWNFEDIRVTSVEEAQHEEPKNSEESSAAAVFDNIKIEVDNDCCSTTSIINENVIEMLAVDDTRKFDVDLVVKTVQHAEGGDDLEFYVPVTRVAECEDGDISNDDKVHLTVV